MVPFRVCFGIVQFFISPVLNTKGSPLVCSDVFNQEKALLSLKEIFEKKPCYIKFEILGFFECHFDF